MEQRIITINGNGTVSVPDKVMMQDFEIAELFEVFTPTVKGKIKQILKEGVCLGDFSNGGFVSGNTIIPEYFGLDMIAALAFRIQSPQAESFRRWVLKKMTEPERNTSQPIYLSIDKSINRLIN